MFSRCSSFPSHGQSKNTLGLPRSRGRYIESCKRRRLNRLLEFEELETRCLLANWVPIGPAPQQDDLPWGNVTGRITSLAITHYFDAQGVKRDVMFVGAASGGVWRSENFTGTPTWTPVTDTLGIIDPATGLGAGAIDVGSIAVVPGKRGGNAQEREATVYVGTGEPNLSGDSRYGTGVLKSVSSGRLGTFSVVSSGPAGADGLPAFYRHSISEIIVDPRNSNVLYAAVIGDGTGATTGPSSVINGRPNLRQHNGIYKSNDAGATWVKLTGGSSEGDRIGEEIDVTDLDYTWDATRGTFVIYAGVGSEGSRLPGVGGIWTSSDGGNTWVHRLGRLFQDALGALSIWRVAFASDHALRVYAAVAEFDNGKLRNVFETTDTGANWTALNPNFADQDQMEYNLALGLSPSGRLYLGGQTRALEYNAASTPRWKDITSDNKPYPHNDYHAFAFTPDGAVYTGTDGGLYRYKPASGTWENLNSGPNGFQTHQIYSITLDPRDSRILLIAGLLQS